MARFTKFCLSLCIYSAAAGAAPTPPKIPQVVVEKAARSEIFDLITYPARLTPKVNAAVLSEFEGIVSSVKAPLGTKVKKGANLLVIKNTDPVYKYAPVSVQSPITGVVSSVDVNEGSRVTRNQKLASITDPSKITILIELAVSDLDAIQHGMPGKLWTFASEEPVDVKVTGLSPSVDPATGTATCELALANTKKAPHLPPGLVGRVSFRAREHKGFQIPDFALVYKGQDPFLRIVAGENAKYQKVTIGPSRQGVVEVLNGLTEGMSVIVRSSGYIADGEKVKVQDQKDGKI